MKRNLKIQIGLRLLFASLILFISQGSMAGFVVAMFGMFMPAWKAQMNKLATGLAEADEKALLDKITKEVQNVVKESQKENVSKEALETRVKSLNEEIAKLTNEAMAELKKRVDEMAKANEGLMQELAKSQKANSELNDSVNKQGLELKKLLEKGTGKSKEERKTFREALKDAFMGEHKDRILTEIKDTESKDPRLSIKTFFEKNGDKSITPVMTIDKSPVDMLESAIINANVNTVRMTELDPQRVGIPLTIYPHVIDVFPTKNLSKKFMSLLVAYSYEDGAGTKTEGSAPSQSSFLLKTVEFVSAVIATYATLSDETLDDLEEVLDELSIVMPDKIKDNIDTQILGSSGNDTTTIKGILAAGKNTAYDSTPFLDSYDSASIIDVISSAKLQAELAGMMPSHVYLSPGQVDIIAAQKNTFDDSRNDRRVAFDLIGRVIAVCGLRVIQSPKINSSNDELLVIDMRQPIIGVRKQMTMEIGYNGTDFVEGQKTVVIKVRLAFGVRNALGIVYVSNVHNAIADITVGS